MKYNATSLLSSDVDSFLPKITPTKSQIDELKLYRKDIRNAIRSAFCLLNRAFEKDHAGRWQITNYASQLLYSEQLRALEPNQKASLAKLTPKFMSQGSFVYKTLNLPCYERIQQIDLDDGVYLPLDIFRDSPIVSKDLFFLIVDTTLKNLAKEKGWKFEEKNTCARLVVNELIHIDVPLYAIPLERHIAMESNKLQMDEKVWFSDSRSLLSKDDIYLAVRNRESWINSDPAMISEWFNDSVRAHGEILRNVCRHLKAWRDYKFPSGGPSSIALMACAVQSFNELVSERHQRFFAAQESEALMLCAMRLEQQFIKGVQNPTDETKAQLYPTANMSENERERDRSFAIELAHELNFSLNKAPNKYDSLKAIKKVLGQRIPERQDLISVISAADILSKPAKTNPAPIVPNGNAG
ncbi:CBASS cGAMP synthase [Photobacterium leiognathi]|uniref:CBASS cGAMP synthase n=1 Tax=Photobacterium leiognathi TaxID=553611 RepID=UPI002981E112|nr:CBASS cGAMP synthase [Photobacterium leiognathi]